MPKAHERHAMATMAKGHTMALMPLQEVCMFFNLFLFSLFLFLIKIARNCKKIRSFLKLCKKVGKKLEVF